MNLLPIIVGDTKLRVFEPTDIAGFFAYRSDPVLARYQSWKPMEYGDAGAFVKVMTSVSQFIPNDWIQLAIACSESNAIVGDVGLFLDADESEAEIGITLSQPSQGKGHGVRAIDAALKLIWNLTSARSVRGITDSRNLNSIRLLERSGFTKHSEKNTLFKGEPCIEIKYVRGKPT